MKQISFCIAAACAAVPFAAAQDIQAERERWSAHARGSDTALSEAVEGLKNLYAQSGDAKVRADLTALLIRQGKPGEALAVCAGCSVGDYTQDELENLAKAARDTKRFALAQRLYGQLQLKAPARKIGYLGGALTAVDAADFPAARIRIAEYRQRFGSDNEIKEAENYLKQRSQTQTERLAQQQRQYESNPDDEAAVALYRTAAGLQAFPLQERLIERHPALFSEQDRLWLKETQAVALLRTARASSDSKRILAAHKALSEVAGQAPAGSELHTQALRDRMAAAVAAGEGRQAVQDYKTLEKQGAQPDYVKEQYAQALLLEESPRQAAKVVRGLLQNQQKEGGRYNPETVELSVRSHADLMQFDAARRDTANWNTRKYIPDFTHNVQIENPYYDTYHFWNARIDAWDGNMKKARKQMAGWLAEYPGDPWGMMMMGELEQADGHEDKAVAHFDRAREFLSDDEQKWVDAKSAAAKLAGGNWPAVEDLASGLPRDNVNYRDFWKLYDEARAAQLEVSGGAMKATSPQDGTEWNETAKLYSPRSKGGHRGYIAQQHTYVPNHGEPLRAGRVGAGAEIHLYPFTLHAEAGHGTHLNNKAYGVLGADLRINDYLSLTSRTKFNSADTPVKALWQGVYADEYTFGAEYTHSAATRAGIGAGVMDFDDGNMRKSANLWLSHDIFQRNRWKLGGSLWADYSRNKEIPDAYYYNPKNSKTLSGELALSYTLPLDNGMKLSQTVSGGAGRYWQAGNRAENTWLLKYGHVWNFGRRALFSYELGRRQAMYDGAPEYQNFGNVTLSLKLY